MMIEVFLIVSLAIMLAVIGGVTLYDLREEQKQKRFRAHPYAKQYRTRPLLTIMVISTGDVDALQRCLNAITKSTYKKYEVIVVSTARQYRVKKLITRYRYVRMSASKLPTEKAALSIYRRLGHGDLVMVLRETSMLDKDTCRRVVWQNNSEKKTDTIILNVCTVSAYSTIGLFNTYRTFLAALVKKTKSAFRIELDYHHENSVVTRENFLSPLSPARTYFAADATIQTRAAHPSFSFLTTTDSTGAYSTAYLPVARWARWFVYLIQACRTIILFALPIAVGYITYIAIVLHQPMMFLLCVAGLGLFLLFSIWIDSTLTTRQKVTYSLLSPVSYAGFYLQSCVRSVGLVIAMIPLIRRRS